MKKKHQNDAKCKMCGRTIKADSKAKLCPDCINKYGTPAAGVGIGGIIVGAKVAWKNKEKIVSGAVKVGKAIASLLKK